MATLIRIAMLNADQPVPAVRQIYPTYGAVFHKLLCASAERLQLPVSISSQDFDVVREEYPSSPDDFDLLLITGSASSSYDNVSWAHRLDAYIREVYERHPDVKMFGSCFGHQIMCQSLLGQYGVKVEKDPQGWELGVHDIQLTKDFVKALGCGGGSSSEKAAQEPALPATDRLPTPSDEKDSIPAMPLSQSSLRLQFIHADHVHLPDPSALPASWIPMGRSSHCAFQGAYQPGRILTYQGHFEFDRFINTETLKVFGAKWDPAVLQSSLERMDKEDDAETAADMVMRFLMEGKRGQPLNGLLDLRLRVPRPTQTKAETIPLYSLLLTPLVALHRHHAPRRKSEVMLCQTPRGKLIRCDEQVFRHSEANKVPSHDSP
ncbi:putative glutamine amidotransferase-like protein-like protein [Emericellopsis cladophorae]|uniref:Glutamine amidotransferase-like protein-like protein n=1 Tax=Emericellopsis cladophorae TaxID=2686198 RepID=A0A9P9YAE5_9HYPO|nr:putative glutamine amidotransferase-like protein-like protein [Emericellopsis cladophorae]KAI6785939.1 putative glutamine amidotransferase-like protein-like protein [Emericellopsis cladophorae]